jgi:NodT family efflux transporter outer membrane factor (OMF) lipoprotein
MPLVRLSAVPLREAFFIVSVRKPRTLGVVVTALFFLAGCAVGPDFVRPAPPAVDRYTQGAESSATIAADGRAQQFVKGSPVPADWWRLFNSAKLDAVMNDAITGNPSIQSAQASLRQSQDNLRAGYGVFYPQFDAGFGASRQKSSPVSLGSTSPGTIFNLFTLSASVSYVLDVFGGERRMVEGLQAQVDVQRAIAQGTYLTLLGNVENTLIAQAGYRDQIKATEQIIGFLKEQVGITEIQVRAGTVPYANVLSLRSQLDSFEASLPPLKQNLSHAEHLLATLTGRTPGEWTPPRFELSDFTLPGELPITLPSELVRQRPDILAAEAQLHSAGAVIGVATAALFPSFTLNGSYGQSSMSINSLFSGNFWSIGADVSAPLFHGGTLWFKRKAAQEGYQQTLAIYRQTVLAALAQVADALRALEHDAEALQAQSQALETAGEALRLIQANYQAGIANYLQVLTANGQYQQARIGYLQAQAQRLQDTVALFTALGGGWRGTDGDRPDAASAGDGTEPNTGKGTVQ